MRISFDKEFDDFPESEKYMYWEYLKSYRDWKNILDTAEKEGVIKIGRNMKMMNIGKEEIIEITGLSAEEFNAL